MIKNAASARIYQNSQIQPPHAGQSGGAGFLHHHPLPQSGILLPPGLSGPPEPYRAQPVAQNGGKPDAQEKDNPNPEYPFDEEFPNLPSGIRKNAIAEAHGKALAWKTSYEKWKDKKRKHEERNQRRLGAGKKPAAVSGGQQLTPTTSCSKCSPDLAPGGLQTRPEDLPGDGRASMPPIRRYCG
ncbi:MAG: hypothetical protein AB1497_11140 [Bacillota bacterium]